MAHYYASFAAFLSLPTAAYLDQACLGGTHLILVFSRGSFTEDEQGCEMSRLPLVTDLGIDDPVQILNSDKT